MEGEQEGGGGGRKREEKRADNKGRREKREVDLKPRRISWRKWREMEGYERHTVSGAISISGEVGQRSFVVADY